MANYRITDMNAHTVYLAASTTWPDYMLALDDYKERVSYDANGNILNYLRIELRLEANRWPWIA